MIGNYQIALFQTVVYFGIVMDIVLQESRELLEDQEDIYKEINATYLHNLLIDVVDVSRCELICFNIPLI